MADDWSVDIAIAPDGALQKIAGAINHPKKRAFGVFKIANEYVGHVREDRFEIWERHQHAVHAVGTVRGRRGGSHVALRFTLPARTRIFIALFFAVYTAAAAGIAFGDRGPLGTSEELAITAAGGLAIAAIFTLAAVKQRTDLRDFVAGVFRDLPRI